MLIPLVAEDVADSASVEQDFAPLNFTKITDGVQVVHSVPLPSLISGACDPTDTAAVVRRIMQFSSARGVLIDDWHDPACSFRRLPVTLRRMGYRGKIGFLAAPFPRFSPPHVRENWRWLVDPRKYLPHADLHSFVHDHLAADGLVFHSLGDAEWFFGVLRRGCAWSRAFLYDWTPIDTSEDGVALSWWNRLPHHDLVAGVYDFHFRSKSTTQLPAERFLKALFL